MSEDFKIIVFSLADEEYGVNVDQVKTIERMQPMTRVPKTPDFVKGVINLRGVVIPIIDLRKRFGLFESQYTDTTRIVIVHAKEIEVGLIVDAANDVIDLSSDQIEDPPEIVGGIRAKYLSGVAKISDSRLLILMNLEEVLNRSEIILLEQIEG